MTITTVAARPARWRRCLSALALAASILAVPAGAGATPTTAARAAAQTITGLDLHDGMFAHFGALYYAYGTQYGCGFTWGQAPTHWCGFGVATAPALAGPWSPVTTLISPGAVDTWTGLTWDAECSRGAAGCFNPRMVQRASDGVYILAFNSPSDYSLSGANAYYFAGCESPTGPCGPGSPHGSLTKPAMYTCSGDGDFEIHSTGGQAYIVCTMHNQTLSIEWLDGWWTGGTGNIAGHGATNLAGFTTVESPGVYQDPASGLWILAVSYRNCGYCAGSGLAYATAPGPAGPFTAPANAGFGTDPFARALISGSSCGGQPRTISTIDGIPYQVIDLWTGARNETTATVHLEPLNYRNPTGHAGDAATWQPFGPFTC